MVLGVPGATTWRPEWGGLIAGIPEVYVWRELDQGGDVLVSKVLANLPDAHVIEPPNGLKQGSCI